MKILLCFLLLINSPALFAGIKQANQFYKHHQFENAYEQFSQLAKQGYHNAYLKLGLMHYFGAGVGKDETQGLTLIKTASEKGNLVAKHFLEKPDARASLNPKIKKKHIVQKPDIQGVTQHDLLIDYYILEEIYYDKRHPSKPSSKRR